MSRPGSIVILVLAAWMLVSLSSLIPSDGTVPAVRAAVERPAAGDQGELRDALDRALEDERHAIAYYAAVMDEHGPRRPFANVIHAERRHAESLLGLYATLELDAPADDEPTARFEVPASFREACDLAEIAEIQNIAMYDELVERVDDERVRTVFESLRAASVERHLPAFRRHGHGWREVDEAKLTREQQTHVEHAEQAAGEMVQRLLTTLMKQIERGGHGSAIGVCREEAPRIAAAVARDQGVRIGRTSFKLRNASNTGPAWTYLLLRDRPEEPRYGVARDGRVAVVLPIHVSPSCLACHGASSEIPDDVHAALNRAYPGDAATGFADGDLRGWFWVETNLTDDASPDQGWGGKGTGRAQGSQRSGE